MTTATAIEATATAAIAPHRFTVLIIVASIAGLAGIAAMLASFLAATIRAETSKRFRYAKQGGLRFIRIGRVQMAFCICRKPLATRPASA